MNAEWKWDFAFQILPQMLWATLNTIMAAGIGYAIAAVVGLLFLLGQRTPYKLIKVLNLSYFSFLAEHGSTLLLGTVTTLKVLICATILYVIISVIFGLMRISNNSVIQVVATVYIEFFRGTSLLVQLFWVYYVLPFLE